MIKRGPIGLLALITMLTTISACSLFEPSETLRYRVTVNVNTPEGMKSGSSVWELTLTATKIGTPILSDYRAEAVAVDMPNGKTLFALLQDGRGGSQFPISVMRHHINDKRDHANWHRDFLELFPKWREEKERWQLRQYRPFTGAPNREPGSGYPMLVSFEDINNPASVVKVDPEDFASSFGPGVRLKNISIEVTDDPVTTGIERRFAWWSQHKNRLFNGESSASQDMTNPDLAAHLASGSFSTEYNK